MNLRDAYAGRTVLVTGHTGFKGAWLVSWLRRLGARVVGYSLPAEQPSLFASAALAEGIEHVEADIRSVEDVKRVVGERKPEVVFHLAAQSLVRRSYDEPLATFETNVQGTANVLEACRAPSVRAVVVITTDKVYENREWLWPYRENDALGGHDPYSASKACAELVTASYRGSFFSGPGKARIATARAGNVIGGGDWAKDRIIPDIVRAAAAGTPTAIRNPGATRPWQHVLEPLAGYLLLGAHLLGGEEVTEAWNFGPRDEDIVPVGRLAEAFVRALGRGSLDVRPDPNAPKETRTLRLDSAKARHFLGWRPLFSLDEAVGATAHWYRAWLDDASTARATLERQVAEYDERLHNP